MLSSFQDEPEAQTEVVDADVFVIDFIAQVRIITGTKAVPDTYEELAIKLLQSIPKGYLHVDLVADTKRSGIQGYNQVGEIKDSPKLHILHDE